MTVRYEEGAAPVVDTVVMRFSTTMRSSTCTGAKKPSVPSSSRKFARRWSRLRFHRLVACGLPLGRQRNRSVCGPGGPHADAGLTGRKIIVDTYGGMGRHGGGAFSGKDPSKVDRSAAYAARWAAKHVVAAGLAKQCEIQLAYVIGVAEPVSLRAESFGTGTMDDKALSNLVGDVFDFRPAAIASRLNLLNRFTPQPLLEATLVGTPEPTGPSLGKHWTRAFWMPSLLRRSAGSSDRNCGGLKRHRPEAPTVLMTTERRSAVVLVVSLLLVSLSPIIGSAAADDAIHLSVDVQHVVLMPGAATNVTLTITNNGSSIDSFDVEVDNASLHPHGRSWRWMQRHQRLPDVVQEHHHRRPLGRDGRPFPCGHGRSCGVGRRRHGGNSPHPRPLGGGRHAPRIEASGAGNGGLVVLQPGDVVDVTVPVHNDGNVVDTMLLDVNANPDLAGFWANWSSTGGSENVSNNQTGGTSTPSYEVLMYGNSYTAANVLTALCRTS